MKSTRAATAEFLALKFSTPPPGSPLSPLCAPSPRSIAAATCGASVSFVLMKCFDQLILNVVAVSDNPLLLCAKNFLNCRANVAKDKITCRPCLKKNLWLVSRGLIEFFGKGYQQLFDGPFDEEDVQNAILFGMVKKEERDETKAAKYKYTIVGPALNGAPLYCCGKIRANDFGEEYFSITFHDDNT